MKRKYFMRGIGIGVIITAIVFTVAAPKREVKMSDEEVIARAQELGYTKDKQNVTPEDIDKLKEQITGEASVTETPDTTKEVTPEGTPGPTMSPVPTPEPPEEPERPDVPATPTATVKATSTPRPTATSTPKPTATQKPTVAPTKTPSVSPRTIKVERGMTATKVAGLLVDINAIPEAADFVAYLRRNNLTDFINIGTFTIPEGAGYEEIARILTK